MSTMLACGVAVLDVQQTVDRLPGPDEKLVADELLVASGGPAANAAVTAAALGVGARLVTRIGRSPLGTLISSDLAAHGVEVVDRAGPEFRPAVSTVLVTRGTGQRAVVSVNASRQEEAEPAEGRDGPGRPEWTSDEATGPRQTSADLRRPEWAPEGAHSPRDPEWASAMVAGVDAVLVDGHHLDLAVPLARAARAAGVPVLLDGGSWKPGLERLLAFVDIALISAVFHVPAALHVPARQHVPDSVQTPPTLRTPPTQAGHAETTEEDVLAQVRALGPEVVARSRGPLPIEVLTDAGRWEVPVPRVEVVDTLGAGDVLHGALCAWLGVRGAPDLRDGLAWAGHVAADSCTAAGARGWLADEDRLTGHRRALSAHGPTGPDLR